MAHTSHATHDRRSGRRRRALLALVGALSATALLLVACGVVLSPDGPVVQPAPQLRPAPIGRPAPGDVQPLPSPGLGAGDPTVEFPLLERLRGDPILPGPPPEPRPKPRDPNTALVVSAAKPRFYVYRTPRSAPWLVFRSRNPYGQVQTFLVTGTRERRGETAWYRIQLPYREGGTVKGWVRARAVEVARVHQRLVIDLSRFTLTWYRKGEVVQRFRVGLGRAGFTTPLGRFYVWAHAPQRSAYGPYGAHALALSALSTVMYGRIAIHGTADPTDVGHLVSHGCIRVYNPHVLKLRSLPLGTPVIIHR